MDKAQAEIVEIFKEFMEAVLIEHNFSKIFSMISEDVVGIGMGAQGVVSCRNDVKRILGDESVSLYNGGTKIEYADILARCYEGRFGTVCGVVKIKNTEHGKTVTSTLGQIASFLKKEDKWWIVALQATPIFEQIEEMEAYPIKFAETVLEAYRRQELIAKSTQNDSLAVFIVDFTKGIVEKPILENTTLLPAPKGAPYEKTMFAAAKRYLKEQEERFRFISTFSLGNVFNMFQNGQNEVWMEYKTFLNASPPRWMKTLIKLYVDPVDENLKGYLYIIDIDRAKKREMELQNQVEHDPMTGLFNKNSTEQKINEKLKKLSPKVPGAFMMVDLDYFKHINDTYGHHEGDRIIKETANCLLALAGAQDVAGRIGGDEFCIYFHGNIGSAKIAKKADKLCQMVRNILPGKTSCSIGVVGCFSSEQTFEEIYCRADKALYLQKGKGRNGHTIDW